MKYYIYIHIREDTGEIFYVGKGTKTEHKRPYWRAFTKSSRNFLWKRITEKTSYKVIILEEFDNEQECLNREIEIINRLGRIIEGDGILSNISNEKDKSYMITEELLQKVRKKVYKYDLEGNFIAEYNSMTEAAIDNNMLKCDISAATNAKRRKHTSGGFQWRSFKADKIEPFDILKNSNYSNPIIQYSLQGEKIKEWKTVSNAARELNISRSAIANCLSGVNKTSGGFIWKYKKGE